MIHLRSYGCQHYRRCADFEEVAAKVSERAGRTRKLNRFSYATVLPMKNAGQTIRPGQRYNTAVPRTHTLLLCDLNNNLRYHRGTPASRRKSSVNRESQHKALLLRYQVREPAIAENLPERTTIQSTRHRHPTEDYNCCCYCATHSSLTARPKSPIRSRLPSSESKRFDSLRSRCITPLSCRYCSPASSWPM